MRSNLTRRLLLDLGNSRLKWVLAESDRPLPGHFQACADWLQRLPALLEDWRRQAIDEIVWASVAEQSATGHLARALARLDRPIRRAQTEAERHGLRCAYPQPARLGVDRWLALLAAHRANHRHRQVLVSAGSAITLDLLLPGGEHAGGLILPGLTAMREGLFAAAPGLRVHLHGQASDRLATDSPDAIASGCLQAALAVIERTRRWPGRLRPCRVLLAGGDGERLAPWLPAPVQLRPHLVLEGLAAWAV